MNTKPFFFLCFLCALLFISAVATEPSKDGRQGSTAEEESDTDVVGLQGWGYGGRGGGWGYGGRGGGWGYGGRGGWGGGYGGRGGWGGGYGGRGGWGGGWGRGV